MTAVAISATTPAFRDHAVALAVELDLPLAPPDPVPAGTLLLRCGNDGLNLFDPTTRETLRCDWIGGPAGYRRRRGGGVGQALARAVGLRGGRRPTVVDATAGLGRDGFVLAWLGCRVTLLERIPVVFALLRDGLERAHRDPEITAQLGDRLRIELADAQRRLPNLAGDAAPEVVYLDPMHPPRRGTARVRKEMRLLRAVVGGDTDQAELLPLARDTARERVVVKLPAGAGPFAGTPPDWTVGGRTTRFDVYRAASTSG